MFVFSCTAPCRPMTTYLKGQQSNQEPSSLHFWFGFQFIFSYFFSVISSMPWLDHVGATQDQAMTLATLVGGIQSAGMMMTKGHRHIPQTEETKYLTMTICYLKSNVILRPRPLSWSLLQLTHMGCLYMFPLLSQASKVIVSFQSLHFNSHYFS